MITLVALATTAGAGLLGSLHCMGMCGPLAAAACATPTPTAASLTINGRRQPSALPAIASYGLGRLFAYAALGAAAGSIGAAVNIAGSLAGIQRIAGIAAGATIALIGLMAMTKGLRAKRPAVGGASLLTRAWARIASWHPLLRAAIAGLLTGLLPCGWLWAFVVAAAGTGSALSGALLMAAFWLGSSPALALCGTWLPRVINPVLRRVPGLTGAALIACGLILIATRLQALQPAGQNPAIPMCHAP